MRPSKIRFLCIGSALIFLVLDVCVLGGIVLFNSRAKQERDVSVAQLQGFVAKLRQEQVDYAVNDGASKEESERADCHESLAGLLNEYSPSLERGKALGLSDKVWGQPGDEWTEEEYGSAEMLVGECADLLKLAREMTVCKEPMVHDCGDSIEHLAAIRDIAFLLYVDMLVRAKEGNAALVVEDALAGFRLGDCLCREQRTIAYVTRQATHKTICRGVEASTRSHSLPRGLTRRLVMGVLSSYTSGPPTTVLVTDEIQQSLYNFEQMRTGGASVAGLLGGTGVSPFWSSLYEGPFGTTLGNLDETTFANLAYSLAVLTTDDYWVSASRLHEIELEANRLPQWNLISQRALPLLVGLMKTPALERASLDLMCMGLLLESHYAQHRCYPDNLNEVVAGMGWEPPRDPFSGEMYVYRQNESGFLLYSLGPNLADDHGVHDKDRGDLVWRGRAQRAGSDWSS